MGQLPENPEGKLTSSPPPVQGNKTSSYLKILIPLAIVILALGIGVFLLKSGESKPSAQPDNVYHGTSTEASTEESSQVQWDFNGNEWISMGNPPSCKEPVSLMTPVDSSRVVSILYPGQKRGGDYKPHGGFRISETNAVMVRAPIDAMLVSGSRYIEQGEVQYLLFFVNPCGISYRFDHLLTLSPELQKVADTLPPAKLDDSRATNFSQQLRVKAGDTIATEVGFKKTANVSVDFGVYDLRAPNAVSHQTTFVQKHADSKEQAFYAVCWLDWLSSNDKLKFKLLPGADGIAGKTSDYCY